MTNRRLLLAPLFLFAAGLCAQDTPTPLPNAPSATPIPRFRTHIWDDYYTAAVICSAGASHSPNANQPTGTCGGAVGLTYLWFEVGALAPQTIQPRATGYFTTDFVFPLSRFCRLGAGNCGKGEGRILPVGTVGFTHIFGTTNALDFSGGVDVALNSGQSLRFELKDYANFGRSPQQNIVFRVALVGWMVDP
jgi:hypothetical protein